MFFKGKYAWPIILMWLLFSACGYQFAGGGSLPSGIQSISIKIFENRSAETGVENVITNDLIYEFTRHGQEVITDSFSSDAVLTGVIESISIETITHRGEYSSLERRVGVQVSLELTDQTGKVIWHRKNISEDQAYQVLSDKQSTERIKKAAIQTLSKRLAEKIYNSLTIDF